MGRHGQGETRLVELAVSLERAAGAYARTVDLIDQAEARASGGPWLGRMRARVRSLLAECRVRAGWLADTPAETPAGCAAKCRALLRYWEMDVDCDPRGLRVLASVCADVARLEARFGSGVAPDATRPLLLVVPAGWCHQDGARRRDG
jgi:hypothetical protein